MAAPFPTWILPQPSGVGSVTGTVPYMPGLIGQPLYSCWSRTPNDQRLSNVVHDAIQ